MSRILLLSNGHGEDLSGALIGKALQTLDHHVYAFPLVGDGHSYLEEGITNGDFILAPAPHSEGWALAVRDLISRLI